MNATYLIAILVRLSQSWAPLVVLVSFAANIYLVTKLSEKKQPLMPAVLAYDSSRPGAPVSLECSDSSEGRERKAVDIAKDLMGLFYEYDKDGHKQYVAKYRSFFPFIDPGSQAERKIRMIADDRIVATQREKSSLHITKAKAKPFDGKVYVAIDGRRIITDRKGNSAPHDFKFNVILVKGNADALFRVSDISSIN